MTSSTATAAAPGRADPHALRRTPARTGNDWWPSPAAILDLLTEAALPHLPAGPVWDVGAGDGRLLRAASALPGRAGGVGSDIAPRAPGIILHDFLAEPPPPQAANACVLVANPPFNEKVAFLNRALALMDDPATRIAGVCFLFRQDSLHTAQLAAALNRASRIVAGTERPIWIPGSVGRPRWSFAWCCWRREHRGLPSWQSITPPGSHAW